MITHSAPPPALWSGRFLFLLILAFTIFQPAAWSAGNSHVVQTSRDSSRLANWITARNNNQNMPFIIVDKQAAMVFVFNAHGKLQGSSPALLGLGIGDDTKPETINKPLSQIKPEERITPAGRFLAQLGKNISNQLILWVDYDDAISLHPVRSVSPKERRLRRLSTPDSNDNRISYGCINVPKQFFDKVIKPSLLNYKTVVYVMPEVHAISSVFSGYKESTEVSHASPF